MNGHLPLSWTHWVCPSDPIPCCLSRATGLKHKLSPGIISEGGRELVPRKESKLEFQCGVNWWELDRKTPRIKKKWERGKGIDSDRDVSSINLLLFPSSSHALHFIPFVKIARAPDIDYQLFNTDVMSQLKPKKEKKKTGWNRFSGLLAWWASSSLSRRRLRSFCTNASRPSRWTYPCLHPHEGCHDPDLNSDSIDCDF